MAIQGRAAFSDLPTVAERTIYFGCNDKHIYLLNAESGELRWRYETEAAVDSSFGVADYFVVAFDANGTIYGLSEEGR
jgi:outer membrane protein assembly factor BamB